MWKIKGKRTKNVRDELRPRKQEKEGELGSRYKALQTRYLKIQRDLQNRMITPTSAEQKNQQRNLYRGLLPPASCQE